PSLAPSDEPTAAINAPNKTNLPAADPFSPSTPLSSFEHPPKDFSYLLRSEIYHPLTQTVILSRNSLSSYKKQQELIDVQDIPQAFRISSNQPPPNAPLQELVSKGYFRAAAILSALQLTSSISPTNNAAIFSLLYTRLACLTLINATQLASQEVKALEDLNSPFYRAGDGTGEHVVPWELRILSVRLQSIGFGDARRGVMGYYELAGECRGEVRKRGNEDKEGREIWKTRLRDLGVRVGNALIEMGDLDGARRFLEGFRDGQAQSGTDIEEDEKLTSRLVLLYLKLGDVVAARRLVVGEEENNRRAKGLTTQVLIPLLSMAEGNFEAAVNEWSSLLEESSEGSMDANLKAMITQNMAVCLLYVGRLDEAQSHLASLVSSGQSFHALTFNLSTIYELCTEKSRSKKTDLAEKLAGMENQSLGWEKSNADLKL
ncbi:hypothetical protein MMC09_000494, partial [Bachmanniomyces sp. S44760]|nr:hypothetical protein [Bachmanniomyces sp. S44760]